jgi:hypothetical protein
MPGLRASLPGKTPEPRLQQRALTLQGGGTRQHLHGARKRAAKVLGISARRAIWREGHRQNLHFP